MLKTFCNQPAKIGRGGTQILLFLMFLAIPAFSEGLLGCIDIYPNVSMRHSNYEKDGGLLLFDAPPVVNDCLGLSIGWFIGSLLLMGPSNKGGSRGRCFVFFRSPLQ